VAETDRFPVYWYYWNTARDLLKAPAIGTDAVGTSNESVWRVILDVDSALAGEHDVAVPVRLTRRYHEGD